MIQKRETIRAIGFKPSNVAKNTLNVDERISRCASLPKEQGSSDNLLMKAFPQTYQNLAFTLLPRANQSSWLFILVAAVVVYLVLPPLLFVIVSSIMPPAEETPRIPTLANFTSIFESFSDFKTLLWNSLVFSIGSSAWALVFGTALAWLAERTNALPQRRLRFGVCLLRHSRDHQSYRLGAPVRSRGRLLERCTEPAHRHRSFF